MFFTIIFSCLKFIRVSNYYDESYSFVLPSCSELFKLNFILIQFRFIIQLRHVLNMLQHFDSINFDSIISNL